MTYQPETGDGAHALDAHQFANALLGNLVASGAAISVGSGTREVDVASGTVVVAGTAHTISAQDPAATLDAASTHPRKDVIYVDNTGSIAVAKGTEEALDPLGTSSPVEDTTAPNPPDLSGTTGTVLAVALVQTDDTVTLQDRRQVGRVPNAIVDALQNLASGEAFNAYPIVAADIATDAVGTSELDSAIDLETMRARDNSLSGDIDFSQFDIENVNNIYHGDGLSALRFRAGDTTTHYTFETSANSVKARIGTDGDLEIEGSLTEGAAL